MRDNYYAWCSCGSFLSPCLARAGRAWPKHFPPGRCVLFAFLRRKREPSRIRSHKRIAEDVSAQQHREFRVESSTARAWLCCSRAGSAKDKPVGRERAKDTGPRSELQRQPTEFAAEGRGGHVWGSTEHWSPVFFLLFLLPHSPAAAPSPSRESSVFPFVIRSAYTGCA